MNAMDTGAGTRGTAVRPGRTQETAKPRGVQVLLTVLKYGVLTIGAISMILPFVDMFLGAIKTPAEILARPPIWISRDPQWNVFIDITRILPMGKLYLNSIIVSVSVTLLVLLTSGLSGFVLAKYQFRGRELIFRLILSTMMFPVFVFLIPNYYILRHIPLAGGNDIMGWGGTGLMQNYLSLILPFSVSSFGIFMMRQFIIGIPDELLDAARIDGCSELRIFAQILMPQIKPVLATLAVFTFIGIWNEYLWTMTVTTSAPDMMTLPVGIRLLRDTLDPTRNTALMRAALAVGVLPVVALFLGLQKYYVRGIVLSGIKG